jgi:alkylhydroperoxidase/carboxymuconolactone decarboxylase family protein YurZ
MTQILDQLAQEVSDTVGVEESAIAALNGVQARIQAAVDAALANGATAEELAPITNELANLGDARTRLAAAVAANAPATT